MESRGEQGHAEEDGGENDDIDRCGEEPVCGYGWKKVDTAPNHIDAMGWLNMGQAMKPLIQAGLMRVYFIGFISQQSITSLDSLDQNPDHS